MRSLDGWRLRATRVDPEAQWVELKGGAALGSGLGV